MASHTKADGSRVRKVYMVSIPEAADGAEWLSIVGLFSSMAKARRFMEENSIGKWDYVDGVLRPTNVYSKVIAINIDRAPLMKLADGDKGTGHLDSSAKMRKMAKAGTKHKVMTTARNVKPTTKR